MKKKLLALSILLSMPVLASGYFNALGGLGGGGGSGSGTLVGPSDSTTTNHAVARWSGFEGVTVVNSVVLLSDTGDLNGVSTLSMSGVLQNTSLTASRALISDGSQNIAVSPTTSTELAQLSGITANVQDQINSFSTGTGFVKKTGDTMSGPLNVNNTLGVTGVATFGNDITSANDPVVYSYNGASPGSVRAGIQLVGSGQNLRFVTAGTEKMRLDSAGDLSATSDPVLYSYNGGSIGTVRAGIQMVGSGQNLRFYTANTLRHTIDSSGNQAATGTVTAPAFITNEANPASAGFLRLANNGTGIGFRNSANSGDLSLNVDAANRLTYNGGLLFSSAGILQGAAFPALTGDVTSTAGSLATTLSSSIAGPHSFTGLLTAATVNVTGLSPTSLVQTDGSSNLISVTAVTMTELSYLAGSTANIQNQLSLIKPQTLVVDSGTGGANAQSEFTYLCNTFGLSGGLSVILPLASANPGMRVRLKKTDGTPFACKFTRTGSDTIDGATLVGVTVQYDHLEVQSGGADNTWWRF